MPLRPALSAPIFSLLASIVLAGGTLAKGEEPTAAVSITPGGPDQPTLVDVTIAAGHEPFQADATTTIFVRATHRQSGEVVESTAAASDVPGAYASTLDLAQPGAWRIAVGGRYGTDTWLFRTATGAQWTLLTLPIATTGDSAAAAAAGEPASAVAWTPISLAIGLAAVLAAALLVGLAVAGTLRRPVAATFT